MWPRRSHTLSSVTKLIPNQIKFKRTKIKQDTFDEIRRIVTCNILSTYTDYNEEFKMYIHASEFKFRAFIIRKIKTIAFYSIKLTNDYKRYTVAEKDLLGIIEALNNLEKYYLVIN